MNDILDNEMLRLLLLAVVVFIGSTTLLRFLTNWKKDKPVYGKHRKIDSKQIQDEEVIDLHDDTVEDPSVTADTKTKKNDDFTLLLGISKHTQKLLNENGIHSFAQLADTDHQDLSDIVSKLNSKFIPTDPESWPKQAELAADGEWDALKEMQTQLDEE